MLRNKQTKQPIKQTKKVEKKEKQFKFIGKNASKYNNDASLGYFNDIASDSGVKLGYTEDGLGYKYNSIIKKAAKANKNGIYSQKDSIANFSDATMCSTFLSGFNAGIRKNKRK